MADEFEEFFGLFDEMAASEEEAAWREARTGTFRKRHFYQLHNNLLAIANETIRALSQD